MFTGTSRAIFSAVLYMLDMTRIRHSLATILIFRRVIDCNSDPLLRSYFSQLQYSYQSIFFRLGDKTHYYD
ncbi:hypothetical protein BDR03DRAFT_965319 [Suillus americanus]|nr:hypothetical protein BDR03DRAFT_965319 [Suillus americanus]